MALVANVLMGAAVGACAVPTLSLTADRFGSRVAGAFGGLPATIAISMFFLGRASGVEAAREAVAVVPMMEGFFGIYLAIFAVRYRRSFWVAFGSAVAGWAVLAAGPALLGDPGIWISMLILLLCLGAAMLVMTRWADVRWQAGEPIKLRPPDIAFRMFLGGGTVAAAVYLGATLGPLVGGMVAAFPTVVSATLYVLSKRSGTESAAAFGKSLCLNALVNVGVFCFAVYWLFEPLGILWGTLAGLAGTVVSGVIIWQFLSDDSESHQTAASNA